jgi:hypothetical protein
LCSSSLHKCAVMVLDDSAAITVVDRRLTASSSTPALHADEGVVAVEGEGRREDDDEQGCVVGGVDLGNEWMEGEGMK